MSNTFEVVALVVVIVLFLIALSFSVPLMLKNKKEALAQRKKNLERPILLLEMDRKGVLIVCDPMLAELISQGKSYDEALRSLAKSLQEDNSKSSVGK